MVMDYQFLSRVFQHTMLVAEAEAETFRIIPAVLVDLVEEELVEVIHQPKLELLELRELAAEAAAAETV